MFSSNDEYTVLYTNRNKIYIYDINLNPSLLCRGSPTRRSLFPPLVGNGHLAESNATHPPLLGNGSPTMRSMFPPLVGNGSPSIFEENVSPIAREWVTYHAKLVSSTGRDLNVVYDVKN